MNIEAMRQAMYTVYAYISAFENHKITNAKSSNLDMTGYIAELARTAIEQAEEQGEPVAWMDEDGDVLSASIVDGTGLRNIPLYTKPQGWRDNVAQAYLKGFDEGWSSKSTYKEALAQRPWVGLTDGEVDEIYTSVQLEVNDHWDKGGTTIMFPLTLYKAIEAKLKEKNA